MIVIVIMLDFCPNSVSTATFPGQGYPFLKKNSRFKTFEEYLDSLVIEEDQKFLKDVDTARVIAQLGYRFDMISLIVILFLRFDMMF